MKRSPAILAVSVSVVVASAMTFWAGASDAQGPPPVGGQFIVNTHLDYFQRVTDVAMFDDGDFVVVWQSPKHPLDADNLAVIGRRFDADGTPETPEFLVPTTATSEQSYPRLATMVGGGFVVVWQSDVSPSDDTSSFSVQARLFDSAGVPLGGQFQVNTYTSLSQKLPDVATGPGGEFLVVWESEEAADGDDDSIRGQLFLSDGTPLGGEFRVNDETTYAQNQPAVASSGSEFVVVWASEFSVATDSDGRSIQARAFDFQDARPRQQFQVNTYTTGDQDRASITPYDGGFIVGWTSEGSNGTDTDLRSVQATEITSSRPAGTEFQVNSYTTGNQSDVSVVADSSGGLLFSWNQFGAAPRHIAARLYRAPGQPTGDQFPLDLEAADFTYPPHLAASSARFVAAWGSDLQQGPDEIDVVGRLFLTSTIFGDGFESGSTSAWSVVVP